ncbi:MAG: dihydrolipoamide acetyltransferase family protein [Planctomycetia bacterium]
METFLMPTLGADMEAGTLVAWRKQPGDALRRGDTIAEVDTEKGVIDVEVFHDGVLDAILVPAGTRVPVGTPLATIRAAGEPAAAPVAAAPAAVPVPPGPPETGEVQPAAAVAPTRPLPTPPLYAPALDALGRLRISPSARRLARELGVDPRLVKGTGREGAIARADIQRTAAGLPAAPQAVAPVAPAVAPPAAPPSADRLDRMRRTIAAAMSRSKREIPHYDLSTTLDLHRAMSRLYCENERRPPEKRLLAGVMLLKAAAMAIREVPELNAVWEGERVVVKPVVHVGVAISLRQGGLVILALHDTASRSLDDLMDGLRDLTARARAGRMKSSELADSTITVTSLGDRGVDAVWGVIYPPQVAIVGFGKIVERPWAMDGGLFVRRVVTATLAADHRVSDGHRGGLYLDAVDRLLQEPERL